MADNITIEVTPLFVLQVKDLGISTAKIAELAVTTAKLAALAVTTAKIADNAVDKDKINADVAGDGLGQNVDGSLEVNVDNVTLEIVGDTLQVKGLYAHTHANKANLDVIDQDLATTDDVDFNSVDAVSHYEINTIKVFHIDGLIM